MIEALTEDQLDALKEVTGIGVGHAASVLSEMLETRVHLQVPRVELARVREIPGRLGDLGVGRISSVHMGFDGTYSGTASLVFPSESARKLVTLLTGDDADTMQMDDVRIGTLSEVGNIVVNGVMGAICNVLDTRVNYALPVFKDDTVDHLAADIGAGDEAIVMVARTRFDIRAHAIEGSFLVFFEMGSFDVLLAAIEALG